MEDGTIAFDVRGNVAVITFDRPDKLNAFSQGLSRAFLSALRNARDDSSVRAVVVTGNGRAFSAGADMAAFSELEEFSDVQDFLLATYRPIVELMTSMPKPIVGAINGPAAGAGASFALACDLRVMSEDAYLMQAFINIGLVPDAGSSWLLARQIGYGRAFEFAIEGTKIDAARCLELGLTNRVVPGDEVLSNAIDWARRLAARPTIAVGLTKRLLHDAAESTLAESVALESDLQRYAMSTDDHAEGVKAFKEKREPNFEGK